MNRRRVPIRVQPATWEYGNPGLAAGIKSRSATWWTVPGWSSNVPGDLALFSAEDCNIEGSVFYETLVTVADWNKLRNGRGAGRAVRGRY